MTSADFKCLLTQSCLTTRANGVRSIDGAEQVFSQLRAAGVHVALNTDLLLTALGWLAGTRDAVICGDDVPQGRPAPYLIFRAMEATGATSVHRVANVGDTSLDLQAGHNAAVRWNIGVLSGAHSRQILEQARHTQLLPSVADLPGLW
jgi:phosphonatase-like hydrolase